MQEVTMTNSPALTQGITVPTYAGHLGISAREVYRLIEKGEVRAFRVGRALRIPASEVERYISAHMVEVR